MLFRSIMAFRQGVRDEKMLEKLATHQVKTVATLFALADKCTRAAEGRAWMATAGHALPARHQAGLGGAQLQQIPARSIPYSCEEARSGGKPTPVAPSPSGGKPTPVALSRLWWLSPILSRLRSHSRLYISVSPTLRGPAGNKIFSFVTM